MKKFTLLGGLTPAQFLGDYWQKKPLLIRGAFPAFKPLLPRNALFEMAASDDVESRLITGQKQHWQMKNGPFDQLPDTEKANWTLLVQGANLYNDKVDALLRSFRFIPDARVDDVMISYATDGGGVGPHFDSYDVFLLQASGKRRWRIGAQKNLDLIEGMPLKILRDFQPDQEFTLEPGDMLYLPPQYAHEGVAIGECMTYSIGFQAPSYQQLGEAFLQFMAESIDLPGRYADPDLGPSKNPAQISSAMLSQVAAALEKVRFTRTDIALFLGEYLTEPKAQVFFDPPARVMTLERFVQTASKRGVKLSLKTRMLYAGKHVFVNGASFVVAPRDKAFLTTLANDRSLGGNDVAGASNDVLESLYCWYQDAWIELS